MMDLDQFLTSLEKLTTEGFTLKEEVYLEAVKEARRIADET